MPFDAFAIFPHICIMPCWQACNELQALAIYMSWDVGWPPTFWAAGKENVLGMMLSLYRSLISWNDQPSNIVMMIHDEEFVVPISSVLMCSMTLTICWAETVPSLILQATRSIRFLCPLQATRIACHSVSEMTSGSPFPTSADLWQTENFWVVSFLKGVNLRLVNLGGIWYNFFRQMNIKTHF